MSDMNLKSRSAAEVRRVNSVRAEMNGRLRRMTIADIPLRACREFPSFKLPMEPDWRGHIGSLCWPRSLCQQWLFVMRS